MKQVRRALQGISFWSLIFAFGLLRGVEQSIDAWFLKQSGFLLVGAWCQTVVVCAFALGVVRGAKFPVFVRTLTGLAAASYAILSVFAWKTHLRALDNMPVQFIVLLVLAGFWGIACVYLAQAVTKARPAA